MASGGAALAVARAVLVAAMGVLAPASPAGGEAPGRAEPPPPELQGVGIDEALGAQVPLDAQFTDASGETVRLADLLRPGVPVILTLNYSNCVMLCSLQLNGLVTAMQQLEWTIGEQFDVVTVSIDPQETPDRAGRTKQRYLGQYGRAAQSVQQGWHFLVGQQPQINAVADAVGFRYRYVPEEKQYAHAAVLVLLSPEGKVSRYLYGIDYEPKTLRLSLVEASAGRVGSVMDQVLLFCFHYDAESGRYAPLARNLMKLGGALTVIIVGSVVVAFWVRDGRRRRANKTTSR